MRTVLLLLGSNVFMTFAWYGHLRFREVPLWQAIGVSWLNCPFRVLPAGTSQPDRLWPVHSSTIENHTGSNYDHRLRGLFHLLLEGRFQVELFGFIPVHNRSCPFCIQDTLN